MLMVATDPVMVVANLQDGPGQDPIASRRAKALSTQSLGNLDVRVAFTPQVSNTFDHRVVASDVTLVQDGRDDHPLREMATHPDNFDRHAIGGRTLDNDPCDHTPQQSLALGVAQLLARPQRRQPLAQVQQLLAEFWGQCRLTGLMRKAFRGLLGLTEGPQCVLPGAFECGCSQPVVWIDVLVAAPSQGSVIAGLTYLLLMVRFKTVTLTLALRRHLI